MQRFNRKRQDSTRQQVALITFVLILFNIGINSVHHHLTAASTTQNKIPNSPLTNSAFRNYQDPIYGIKIEYPLDWKKTEGNNYVEFQLATVLADNNKSKVNTSLTALEIKVDNLPSSIDSLEKYTRAKLIPHRQYGQFELIELNRTTIAGNIQAIKTVYTNTFPNTGTILKTMEITMVKDNLGYDIRYFTNPAVNYPRNLPLVQKMLDSFEFVGLTP